METNKKLLRDALELALADEKFMGDKTKVDKAIDALTPKSTVSATFKRLQGNARRDFNDKKEEGTPGYTEHTKAGKIKKYVHDKFKAYMENPKTKDEATKLYYAAYPQETEKEPEG